MHENSPDGPGGVFADTGVAVCASGFDGNNRSSSILTLGPSQVVAADTVQQHMGHLQISTILNR
jgi:hypothetical protein